MKKLLTILLVLILLAGGLFLWKGGHHALFLAEALEEWLDADDGDQSMTIQLQRPGFTAEEDTLAPRVEQLLLSADTFWTEYHDRRILGLTAQGVSGYTDGRNLYLDTGKAYALPELSGLRTSARKLALGLLLHGRITRDGDSYLITMDTSELELDAVISADRTIRTASVTAVLPDETAISVTMNAKPAAVHAIPQPVLDAMVRAQMEPPMALSEPLEVLLPALEDLLPLEGEMTLGVECGILNISDTAILRMDGETAELERRGALVSLPLSGELSQADPAALALLFLRNGTFTRTENGGQFDLTLPAELTKSLCSALVPQLEDVGIPFSESRAAVTIAEGKVTHVTLTADGEVPFLLTTIPIAFLAELTIP